MKLELILFLITAFFIANTYYEGKWMKLLMSWKKYYQMAFILFIGFSFYLYMKKNPSQSHKILNSANEFIKYMPVDSHSMDMLTPFLDFTLKNQGMGYDKEMQPSSYSDPWSNAGYFSRNDHGSGSINKQYMPGEKRILQSGGAQSQGQGPTKRSVSESKKKYVAANQNWTCGNCKKQLPAWFEVDHKVRLEYGGTNHVDNLVALCRDCHGQKTLIENL